MSYNEKKKMSMENNMTWNGEETSWRKYESNVMWNNTKEENSNELIENIYML